MQEVVKKNRYFLQLIPIHLITHSKKPKPKLHPNSQVKFTLFIDNSKVAESRDWMIIQSTQNPIKCKNNALDFYIAQFNPDLYSHLTLKIILKQHPKSKQQSDDNCNDSFKADISQLGHCQLDPGLYIQIFNDDHKALFQQNIQISTSYSLDYEVYIERTRFNLEKLINRFRGETNAANILATAFKKRKGKEKIRYVEIDNSGEKSVKEQQFKKSKKHLITSLKKSGTKYIPQKTIGDDLKSSRHLTPIKFKNKTESTPLSQITPSSSVLKCLNKTPAKQSSLQISFPNVVSPRYSRGDPFERSRLNAFEEHETSMSINRMNVEACINKLLLILFWGGSLFLLYLTMSPSKKI